jgi:hypothetical protein
MAQEESDRLGLVLEQDAQHVTIDPAVRAFLARSLASTMPVAATAVADGCLDAHGLYVVSGAVLGLRAAGHDHHAVDAVERELVALAVSVPPAELARVAAVLRERVSPPHAPEAGGVDPTGGASPVAPLDEEGRAEAQHRGVPGEPTVGDSPEDSVGGLLADTAWRGRGSASTHGTRSGLPAETTLDRSRADRTTRADRLRSPWRLASTGRSGWRRLPTPDRCASARATDGTAAGARAPGGVGASAHLRGRDRRPSRPARTPRDKRPARRRPTSARAMPHDGGGPGGPGGDQACRSCGLSDVTSAVRSSTEE